MDLRRRRVRTAARVAVLSVVVALLAACGGSDGSGDAVDHPLTASAEVPSAVAEGTGSASGSSSGSATGTAPGSPIGAAGAGSPTALPMSSKEAAFEADPAVKALRLYYLGAAKAVNARSWNQPELKASTTKAWYAHAEHFITDEYGNHYPGPIPFGVVAVTQTTPTGKQVLLCVLADGWLQDPKTRRPTLPRRVIQGVATVVRQGSTWRVDYVKKTSGSCAGMLLREVTF